MKAGETPEQAIIRLHFQEKLTPRKVRNAIGCGQERVTNAIEYYKKYHQIPAPKKNWETYQSHKPGYGRNY